MNATNSNVLLAGAAEVDITPPKGIQLGGDACRYRPVQEIMDPIYARALVVESRGRRLCLVSMDVTGINDHWTDEVRRRASERFGLAPDALMLHATQNHSAPWIAKDFLMGGNEDRKKDPNLWWMGSGDGRYPSFVVPRILDAIGQAIERLEPVSIGAARGMEGRVAFNRRYIMRDGTVQQYPQGEDRQNILYVEGPMDPEVGVVCFRNQQEECMAALLHFTAHPVSFFREAAVSASWPGAWAARAKQVFGSSCVPLVVNGCCGNIDAHNTYLDPGSRSDHVQAADRLMETTRGALERMTYLDDDVVDSAVSTLQMPLQGVNKEVLADARKLLKEHPDPIWTNDEHTALDPIWVFAVHALDQEARARKEKSYDYEVQVFRIGPVAVVGLTGEPFVEGQLRIKLESPLQYTLVAHMCNGVILYIPTKEAFHRISCFYRTPDGRRVQRGANMFKLAPDALDRITDEAVKLIRQLAE